MSDAVEDQCGDVSWFRHHYFLARGLVAHTSDVGQQLTCVRAGDVANYKIVSGLSLLVCTAGNTPGTLPTPTS